HQSFAIGTRDLSQALSGIPQEGSLHVAFQEAYRKDDETFVMTFNYAYDDSKYGRLSRAPCWTVWVRAVPRALKHKIKTLLIEDALPNIARPWLIARADLFGRMGQEALQLVFDEIEEKIRGRSVLTTRPLEPALVRSGRSKE